LGGEHAEELGSAALLGSEAVELGAELGVPIGTCECVLECAEEVDRVLVGSDVAVLECALEEAAVDRYGLGGVGGAAGVGELAPEIRGATALLGVAPCALDVSLLELRADRVTASSAVVQVPKAVEGRLAKLVCLVEA
jgi:hypothetical protein